MAKKDCRERAKERAASTRDREIVRRGGRCMDCNKPRERLLRPFEFDHRPNTIKLGNIADLVCAGVTDQRLNDEMAKCDLVCHPCHGLRTSARQVAKNQEAAISHAE